MRDDLRGWGWVGARVRRIGWLLAATAWTAIPAVSADASAAPETPLTVAERIDCRDARYVVGAALVGDEVPGRDNPGEIRSVERIVVTATSRTAGFLYTLHNGTTYVSDRSTKALTLADLTIMNALVQTMGGLLENAFDPRDNGFVYYLVRWNPRTATDLGVTLGRC